jgi:hypothetical protein
VQELAATQGKRFAVIADEAHSSQTGEAAAKLKQVLSAEELAELADGGEVSTEDMLAAQMAAVRGDEEPGASPTSPSPPRPRPRRWSCSARAPTPAPAGPDNLPQPFHVYSMRQAIEEGFILDVLKNYTRTSWPSSWPTTARSGREGGRAQRGHEGHHALGAPAPYNIARRCRSWSSTSARTCSRC